MDGKAYNRIQKRLKDTIKVVSSTDIVAPLACVAMYNTLLDMSEEQSIDISDMITGIGDDGIVDEKEAQRIADEYMDSDSPERAKEDEELEKKWRDALISAADARLNRVLAPLFSRPEFGVKSANVVGKINGMKDYNYGNDWADVEVELYPEFISLALKAIDLYMLESPGVKAYLKSFAPRDGFIPFVPDNINEFRDWFKSPPKPTGLYKEEVWRDDSRIVGMYLVMCRIVLEERFPGEAPESIVMPEDEDAMIKCLMEERDTMDMESDVSAVPPGLYKALQDFEAKSRELVKKPEDGKIDELPVKGSE